MAYQEYFVGEVFFKQETGNSNSIQVENIAPFIKMAALMWQQSILGSYFMNDLLVKYNAGTLSVDEQNLVLQMKPGIAWRAEADVIQETSVKMSNKGLQKQNSDFSTEVDDVTIANRIIKSVQRAEFYESFLIKYLTKNKDLFPVFLSDENDDSIIKPKKDADNNFSSFFKII